MRNRPSGKSGIPQTHCKRGHEFTPKNIAIFKSGKRVCRICKNKSSRESMMLQLATLPEEELSLRRKRARLRKYKLTPEQFDRIAEEQNHECKICSQPCINLHVDHCHKTGRVRGLICKLCNWGLGHFQDSPSLMERAASYVRSHRTEDLFDKYANTM